MAYLGISRDISCQEQPKQSLRERFFSTFGLWKHLLAFGNGQTTETDALIRIKNGCFSYQPLHATHTSIGLTGKVLVSKVLRIKVKNEMPYHVNSDLSNFHISTFFAEFLDSLLFRGDFVCQNILQIGLLRVSSGKYREAPLSQT